MSTSICPCGSGNLLDACCGHYHAGHPAPSAETLMRSRYSAYVLGLLDYLLATWHPSTVPGDLELDAVKWLGLEVKAAAAQGDAGVVEFVARYRDSNGRAQRLHEISRFVRQTVRALPQEESRWFYVDGQFPEN